MLAWSLLVLYAVGAVAANPPSATITKNRDRRFTFLDIAKDKTSSESSYKFPILPAELPIQLGGHGGVNLPVLVLPVPVPLYTKSDTCDAHQNKLTPVEKAGVSPQFILPPYVASRFYGDASIRKPTAEETISQSPTAYTGQYTDDSLNENNYVTGSLFADTPSRKPPSRHSAELGQLSSYTSHDRHKVNKVENQKYVVDQEQIPYSEGRGQIFATTEELIRSFRQESPNAPELPAVVPRGRQFPERISATKADAPLEATIFAPSPPRPDFGESLRLRIDLTVPRSDYTEVYDIEWHAESNTAHTVVEDGATVFYQVPLLDGRIQYLKVQEDRINGSAVRRCTMSPMLPASPADRTFPGLPDLSLFNFVGYTAAEDWPQVEHWRHWVIGKPGEGGAAPGESLNFSHDFFMYRDGGDAMPLKYTVATNSSVLGPACDSYTHRYRLLPKPTAPVFPDTSQCDVTEELKEEQRRRRGVRERVSRVRDDFHPISNFLGRTRPEKYESMFDKFKNKYGRRYRDNKENAVRKQQFINRDRFVEAANRVAVNFKTRINFAADRLKKELQGLFGAVPPPPGAVPPPEARPEFDFGTAIDMAQHLPDHFDWKKDRSFETPVRHQAPGQSNCMSCWAFAVAGATEGALYSKTKQNVPLSTQVMIDCAKPYNLTGCSGGWPIEAFAYVKDHGLPAWDEYTYEAQEQPCKKVDKVTHISEYHEVAKTEEALKVAIYHRAPTVVVLMANADSFVKHHSGILDDTKCSSMADHAVLAVGWGSENGGHFIIKNSWGSGWGENGYARVSNDYCGITDYASYPVLG